MMEGTLVYTGRIVEVRDGPAGVVGQVSVRGARVEVALDLVPGARAGDDVLVHAGVALSIVEDPAETGGAGSRGG
jgi:hydrogenase maturation factor